MDTLGYLQDRFCDLPFSFAEIHVDGRVYVCCPRYTNFRAIGNVFTDSPEALWNSQAAAAIRQGIRDGSFSGCDRAVCPAIVGRELPARADADRRLGALAGAAPLPGPRTVKLAHDDSCNLSCPSCRDRPLVAGKERQARLDDMLQRFILPFLKNTQTLILSGDGDPFASKHYRDIMRQTADTHPALRIGLHTNGVLCDARAWEECRLDGRAGFAQVSIDAAAPETYGVVRRGGDFARLLRNLEFLAGRRRAGALTWIVLAFVVQARNFREMPAFVRLGQALGADQVVFSLIRRWDRAMSPAAFDAAQVWRADHPEHAAFLETMRDPVLHGAGIDLGDTAAFADPARRPAAGAG